jgi:signal transduction histidine kinase
MVLALAINALEATSTGGHVTIVARAEPQDHVTIQVRDNGRGIPREHLADIFEPFFSTKEGENGVGLGLPVVYGIATRHHGTVSVDSTPGEGTVFTVRLPLRQPRDPSPTAGEKEVGVS